MTNSIETVIITKARDCNVKQFMACLFDNDLTVLIVAGIATKEQLQDAFDAIFTEFIDKSGATKTQELQLMKTIQSLSIRNNVIASAIYVTRISLQVLKEPNEKAFSILSNYGHKLYWNEEKPDPEAMLKRLVEIEAKEARYQIELKNKVADLEKLHKQAETGQFKPKRQRKEFIKQKNALMKFGFPVDMDKTNMEEYAYMVEDYTAACQEAIAENNKTKRHGRR